MVFLNGFIFNPAKIIMRNFRIVNNVLRIFRNFMEDVMTEICDRIKEQSNKIGISGKELANLLGLKKSPLTDWKNQKSKPTLEQVIKMCEIFAVSPDYLLFGKNKSLSGMEIKLLNFFNEMSPCDQEELLMIAEMKANKGKRNNNAKLSPLENDNIASEIA